MKEGGSAAKGRFPPLLRGGSRQGHPAFSLIEVVITLGLITFAMVSILGVLAVGLTVVHEASQKTAYAHIVRQISGDIGLLSFDSLTTYADSPQYYSWEGQRVKENTDGLFVVNLTRVVPSYPGSEGLSALEDRIQNVEIRIRRPGEADGFRTTLSVLNPSTGD